jgi:hypothetical protein
LLELFLYFFPDKEEGERGDNRLPGTPAFRMGCDTMRSTAKSTAARMREKYSAYLALLLSRASHDRNRVG